MARDGIVANVVNMDKQGRICLGGFLRENVKVLSMEYSIDSNLVYIFSPENNNSFFLRPTVSVDLKNRIIIPVWMRKYLDSEKLGIAFEGDKLVLVPIYDS